VRVTTALLEMVQFCTCVPSCEALIQKKSAIGSVEVAEYPKRGVDLGLVPGACRDLYLGCSVPVLNSDIQSMFDFNLKTSIGRGDSGGESQSLPSVRRRTTTTRLDFDQNVDNPMV
jgi:hypothetical protein